MRILIFDLETTGPDPWTAVPVSAAVVEWSAGGKHKVLIDCRINPGQPIPPEATAIHGITDADVANSLAWDQAVRVLQGELEVPGTVVIAHNVLYDGLIYRRAVGPDAAHVDWLCSLTWARSLWWGKRRTDYPRGGNTEEPDKRTLDLSSLARRFRVLILAHNAMGDVMALADLLADLKAECKADDKIGHNFDSMDQLRRFTREEADSHSRFLARCFPGGRRVMWKDVCKS